MGYYYGYLWISYLWPWRREILVWLLPYMWEEWAPKDCPSLWEELIHSSSEWWFWSSLKVNHWTMIHSRNDSWRGGVGGERIGKIWTGQMKLVFTNLCVSQWKYQNPSMLSQWGCLALRVIWRRAETTLAYRILANLMGLMLLPSIMEIGQAIVCAWLKGIHIQQNLHKANNHFLHRKMFTILSQSIL